MGVGSGGGVAKQQSWASAAEGGHPGFSLHDADKVERGLIVLFFGLVFSVNRSSPWKFSADALGNMP